MILTFASLPSTQTHAAELARQGAADGTVVHAHEQTAGRGRHGRTWLSGPGSLCFSIVWRDIEPETAFHCSFIAAVALADALSLQIKWPNDLYREKKKVGGILATLEMEPTPSVIVGIGLNLTFQPDEARAGMLGQEVALEPLLARIEKERAVYEAKALAAKVRARLAFVGEKVQVVTQSGTVVGMLESIDDTFQLVLSDENGRPLRVAATEVWPVEGV